MVMTFLTVLASIYMIFFLLVMVGLFVQFYNMPSWQRDRAKINISGYASMGFLVSVSWLIARFFN